MQPQPTLPPLPPSLGNSNPPPSFATFAFSAKFRRTTLQERLGYGPHKSKKALPASGSSRTETPAAIETMDIDPSVDGNNDPETHAHEGSLVDAGHSQTPEPGTGPAPAARESSPDDIWTYSAKVQNEWASVERPSLSNIPSHHTETLNHRHVSLPSLQVPQDIPTALSTVWRNDEVSLTNGLAQQGLQYPEQVHHPPVSHKSEAIKKEGKDADIKQEELPPSLGPANHSTTFPSHPEAEARSSLEGELMTRFMKKEESPIPFSRSGSQGSLSSSTVFNAPEMNLKPAIGQTQSQVNDLCKTINVTESHYTPHRTADGSAASNSIYFGTKSTSLPNQDHHSDGISTHNAERLSLEPEDLPNPRHTPVQMQHFHPQNAASTNPPLPSPSSIQTTHQRGEGSQPRHQGHTHREPVSAHASQLTRSTGYPGYSTRTETGFSFSGSRSATDGRGRNVQRDIASLPKRPSGGYRSCSPRRFNSPPRFSGRYHQTPPRARSPHTPRRYPPRPLPLSRSCSRSPVPFRGNRYEPRRDVYAVDRRRALHQSRSRSPPQRWAERSPPIPSPPRGGRYNDLRRGSTGSYVVRSGDHNPSFSPGRPGLSPYRATQRAPIMTADCYRPNREGRDPPNTSFGSYIRPVDSPHRTPSSESGHDHYQPGHSRRAVNEARDMNHSHHDSLKRGDSPMYVESDALHQEGVGSYREDTQQAVYNLTLPPRMSPRSHFFELHVAEPIQNATLQTGKRYRDEAESNTEAVEEDPSTSVGPETKRRKLNDEDIEVPEAVVDARYPIGGMQETIPPEDISSTVSLLHPSVTEEYALPPSSGPPIVQNRLLMRMAGNRFGYIAPLPVNSVLGSVPQLSPVDPDEVYRSQERRSVQTSSITVLENPPATGRITLKARLHGNQPQNNTTPTRAGSPPSSTSGPVEASVQLLNHVSSLISTPLLQVGGVLEAQRPPLIGRIEFEGPSRNLSNGDVEVSELPGSHPTPSRFPSRSNHDTLGQVVNANEQNASHLLARVGLPVDQVAQRPRQGPKGGLGTAPRASLADRLD